MNGIVVGPHYDIKSGDLISDATPASSGPGGVEKPAVQHILADKETLQDTIAEFFNHDQHVNVTVVYDDAGNLLVLNVDTTSRHEHDQAIAATTWVVNHNFGKTPFAVHVVDTAGDDVIGDVQHIDVNTTHIIFSAAFAGKAYLGA